jgi:8-oxo-dGTP pyrophosphatase MutT (NUDIX family)
MELMKERVDSPALPSASVVLLRDGAEGLEVFLLKRHGLSDVLGGAYVFPGGKVDAEDAGWASRTDSTPAQLHALLGEPELGPDEAAALFVTAIREAFEETGVLFADVSADQARADWAALRTGARFGELLEGRDLRLSASRLHPWSRWVTPTLASVSRKRFDTRFFLATMPAGQDASHDTHEATESLWLSPRTALRQYWDGAIELAPPQIMGLVHLARHPGVASALQAAQARTPPCIRPQPFDVDGVRTLCYPGDPWHSSPEQVLPGPTRLHYRNRRFEPDGGLAILLGE